MTNTKKIPFFEENFGKLYQAYSVFQKEEKLTGLKINSY